jgi:hypothetical protein
LATKDAISIPRLMWYRLVGELRRRGQGQRESGAFLLGRASASRRRVVSVAYYDDLDPAALDKGYVLFRGSGYSALWALCAQRSLVALADIHTHPGPDVGQSSIDQHNPMVPVAGHVAMIAPSFGWTSRWSMAEVGIHVFEGGGRWKRYVAGDHHAPIELSLW